MKAVKIVSLLLSLILTLSLFAACGAKDNGKESEQETTQAEKDPGFTVFKFSKFSFPFGCWTFFFLTISKIVIASY